jgi:hypothetical protein
MVSCEDIS